MPRHCRRQAMARGGTWAGPGSPPRGQRPEYGHRGGPKQGHRARAKRYYRGRPGSGVDRGAVTFGANLDREVSTRLYGVQPERRPRRPVRALSGDRCWRRLGSWWVSPSWLPWGRMAVTSPLTVLTNPAVGIDSLRGVVVPDDRKGSAAGPAGRDWPGR